jgi:serine/threonine protein kinase
MSITATDQGEPIAGYRLIERLGGGAFGEVWKAEAPGGLFKAVKLVHGNLNEELSKSGSAQELKALNRMKTIHHPFILGLERIDIVDGRLIVVTELADGSLWDRFEKCQAEGLSGIPRVELLRFMAEAAEAIDMMNIDFGLQHLDIKPQNLFLMRNHVKVGDFGMVKDLEGMTATMTGNFTPAYAAPETYDSKLSKSSDQYSLAIVYQELLTGKRPFNGTNGRQLMMQHCAMAPDLSLLPEIDRPAVLRALDKDHQKRFPSCSDFVQALRSGYAGRAVAPDSVAAADAKGATAVDRSVGDVIAPSAPTISSPFAKAKTPQPKADQAGAIRTSDHKANLAAKSDLSSTPSPEITSLLDPSRKHEVRSGQATPRCPRCGQEAIQSAAAIWCLTCHYRASLETELQHRAAERSSQVSLRSAGDLWNLVRTAPSWVWVLLAGIAVTLALSIAPYLLFDESSQMRLDWAKIEFTVGLLGFFIGHMWVLLLFSKDEANLGLFSAKLWLLAGKRLPRTRWQFYLGSWGMIASIGGFTLGAGFWWAHPTAFDKPADSDLVAAVRRLEERQTDNRESVGADFARKGTNQSGDTGQQGNNTSATTSEPTNPDTQRGQRGNERVESRPTEQCVIIGYRLAPSGNSLTLTLGILRDNKIVPAGEVEQSVLAERGKELLSAFRGLERPQPPSWWTGSASESTVWLKPGELFCEVHRTNVADNGTLVEPAFKALLKKK